MVPYRERFTRRNRVWRVTRVAQTDVWVLFSPVSLSKEIFLRKRACLVDRKLWPQAPPLVTLNNFGVRPCSVSRSLCGGSLLDFAFVIRIFLIVFDSFRIILKPHALSCNVGVVVDRLLPRNDTFLGCNRVFHFPQQRWLSTWTSFCDGQYCLNNFENTAALMFCYPRTLVRFAFGRLIHNSSSVHFHCYVMTIFFWPFPSFLCYERGVLLIGSQRVIFSPMWLI